MAETPRAGQAHIGKPSRRAAAQRDALLSDVTRVVRLFQWLLPGLVTNVAFLRAQLEQA